MTAWPFGGLLPLSYDVIVADPPWDFELYSENGSRKAAARHYELMSLAAIQALPVSHLSRGDCLLLLWATSPLLPCAIATAAAWGFVYKTHLVWRKVTKNRRVRWGTGYRARTGHESVILATIGNPTHKPFPSIFDGLAREHSRKPDEFYDLVEKHTTGLRRADIFARQSRAGWETFGDQRTKFDLSRTG